jgi:hypothetical protein
MPARSANQWSLASRRQQALMATGGVLAATGFGGAIAAQHVWLFPLMGATGLIAQFATLVRVRRSAAAVREYDEHARTD